VHSADSQVDPFLAACQGKQGSRTPVWFMRQAGRSLPEYRAARGEGSMLDTVRNPALAAELTLQPVRRYHVDAAILYSDIMVPLAATGFGVEVQPGIGPVVARPFRTPADLDRLHPFEPARDAPWVAETVRILAAGSPVPVIGFAGGPFTLASYLVEGGPSRDHVRTKALMYAEPRLWASLMERLAATTVASLRDQVAAGAAAVQVFDSWIGTLSPSDYRAHVLPAVRQIFAGLEDLDVPRIHFGVGTGELLGCMAEAGADVIGVDWRVPLAEAVRRAPGVRAVQGNLDPAVCLAPWDVVAAEARRILRERPAGYGHIFNLGHGVLPQTDPDILTRLVDLVHEGAAPG
jgi:uroporphyrinogen decarboxylase